MIEARFLADLRRQHRAELILVMVQLEQLCPGSWLTLQELAEQLGTDRASLNRSIRKLEDLNLLRRTTVSNYGGTWVWWVKQHATHQPDPLDEPAWVLQKVSDRSLHRVPISQRWEWAKARSIPRQTFRSFLAGQQLLLRKRWKIASAPCLTL